MTPPATAVRQRVREIVEDEFSAEGWEVTDDKLPRASGHDGVTRLAVYPEDEHVQARNHYELIVPVVLQVYLGYEAKIDEFQQVDPGIIEAIGDRLRRAFENSSVGTTSDLWFLNLIRIEYPDDPTGNKSRLEAHIEGHCENPAVQ